MPVQDLSERLELEQLVSELSSAFVRIACPTFPMIMLDTELPWYVEQIRKGRRLRFERLPDGLPPEARAERDYVARSGCKSHLMLPFTVGGLTLGALGREGPVWRRPRLVLLLMLGLAAIVSAVPRVALAPFGGP